VGNSTRPRRVGQDDDEENRKEFFECGEVHSLAMDVRIALITQPIQNLRGSNVHDT